MELHGVHWIGGAPSRRGSEAFRAVDPTLSADLGPEYVDATPEEIDRAVDLADESAPVFASLPRTLRAEFLERVATEIGSFGDALIRRARAETALPEARLLSERARTTAQLRMFAAVVRDGGFLDARIERGDPSRKPLPKPDLRRANVPLGPIAVFGASNFPLAFSVPGGDVASALAAGCPVVAKGHPAHPGTSEMCGAAIVRAAEACKLPVGVFALVHGRAHEVGARLVRHPLIRAVAFTGSLRGGRALFDHCASRAEPIPVFAEMGSINPVFLLPGALAARSEEIAEGLAAAVLAGVGQFCTKPGLVVVQEGPGTEAFIRAFGARLLAAPEGVMLHGGLAESYRAGVRRLMAYESVASLGAPAASAPGAVRAAAFSVPAAAFVSDAALQEEIFGPATLIVRCPAARALRDVASALRGQLTASVHAGGREEFAAHADLVALLAARAGRLVFNGFPTGVEVNAATMHGGPYPASTASHATSVGTAAIARFLRPVAFQDAPASLLPPELRDPE